MSYSRLVFALAVCGLIGACDRHSDGINLIRGSQISVSNGSIKLEASKVTLNAKNTPQAGIDSTGHFSVDGKLITVNDAQQLQLKHYYDASVAIRQHGIDAGKTGIAMAGAALKDATASVFKGDGDGAKKRVDARVDDVKQAVRAICTDLADIRTAQNQLGSTLPAFKPYANLVQKDDVDDCMKDDEHN
ncbi:MAG: DUF2884 family protein [Rhodanobacter sp.]